jgi:hypothetical protein
LYDETIYNFCARARFAGCTFLRNIILALNTVWYTPPPPSQPYDWGWGREGGGVELGFLKTKPDPNLLTKMERTFMSLFNSLR